MTPRLATSVRIAALLRQVKGDGGFGAVLQKGDPTSGSVMLVLLEKGRLHQVYEQILGAAGSYEWREVSDAPPDSGEVPQLIARRRHSDPDLWAIELDVPSAERFAAEMNALN